MSTNEQMQENRGSFTDGEVEAAVREALLERGPGFVYNPIPVGRRFRCLYASNGEPSCLVGMVINKLTPKGFKLLAEGEASGEWRERAGTLSAEDVLPHLVDISDKSHRLLAKAQSAQDVGASYREVARLVGLTDVFLDTEPEPE